MFTYQVHTIESAPGKSKPALEQLERVFGFVPNIAGAIANSPVLANSLLGLFQNVHGGSFTEAEIQTLLLTNAVTNSSPWAVAFHTALALKEGLHPADVQAIRERPATETSPIRCPFQIGKDVDRESRPGDRWRSNDFRRSRV
jgi:hypothetical protein